MTIKMNAQQIKELAKSELACGDCRGLTKAVLLPTADRSCGEQGQPEDSKICEHFRSNVYDIKEALQENGDRLAAMFDLFADMSDKDLRLVAGLLLKEHRTRRYGFKLGQPVFVRYRGREGRNYLNNFMAARVLDIDEKEIRIINEDGTIILTYAHDDRQINSAIYDKESFRDLRAEMIEANKLVDPEQEIKTARRFVPLEGTTFSAPSELDGFKIPMMDDVIKGRKPKTKKRTSTLLDLVTMIESGNMLGNDVDDDEAHELEDDYVTEKVRKVKKVKKAKSVKVVSGKKVKKVVKKAKKVFKGPLELGDL